MQSRADPRVVGLSVRRMFSRLSAPPCEAHGIPGHFQQLRLQLFQDVVTGNVGASEIGSIDDLAERRRASCTPPRLGDQTNIVHLPTADVRHETAAPSR